MVDVFVWGKKSDSHWGVPTACPCRGQLHSNTPKAKETDTERMNRKLLDWVTFFVQAVQLQDYTSLGSREIFPEIICLKKEDSVLIADFILHTDREKCEVIMFSGLI